MEKLQNHHLLKFSIKKKEQTATSKEIAPHFNHRNPQPSRTLESLWLKELWSYSTKTTRPTTTGYILFNRIMK